MSRSKPLAPEAKTWQLIAVDEHGIGHGTCGHRHETDLDAVRCSWTPEPWPVCCDLLVRQVRDTVGQAPRWKRPQLELFPRRAA
jgi:hypothetical protein